MAKRKRRNGDGFSGPRDDHNLVQIGDTLDVFPLLFPEPKDFLVSYNIQRGDEDEDEVQVHRRRVRADDMRGKTILVYMVPLRRYEGLPPGAASLIAAYNDTDYDFPFEVVIVPVFRRLFARERYRYRGLVSKMPPWPAVRNKVVCDRFERAFYRWEDHKPCWIMVDAGATVLLTSEYFLRPNVFELYGIGELVPFMHNKILPLILQTEKERPQIKFNRVRSLMVQMCWGEERPAILGINNLKQLLGSPSPDFLLTKDGTKVPFSSLENKVVGLYFRNHTSSRRFPNKELIKKTYEEAIRLGYDFEIVQINFHSSPYFHGDPPYCCEDIPWLTLPYMHSCCKRLVRLFKLAGSLDEIYYARELNRDRLVIIDPHEYNIYGDCSFDQNGADVICYLGIDAYPFTQRGLVELENRRIKEEIKLQLILEPQCPLLRRRGESYEQVPFSQLLGKWVMLIFATRLYYKSSEFVATIESQYLEQQQQMNDVLEVVYISLDDDASAFDDCTTGMPWLVHPYSWEFAHKWWTKIFTPGSERDDDIVRDDGCAVVVFRGNGELKLNEDIYLVDYPLTNRNDMISYYEYEILRQYGMPDKERDYWGYGL